MHCEGFWNLVQASELMHIFFFHVVNAVKGLNVVKCGYCQGTAKVRLLDAATITKIVYKDLKVPCPATVEIYMGIWIKLTSTSPSTERRMRTTKWFHLNRFSFAFVSCNQFICHIPPTWRYWLFTRFFKYAEACSLEKTMTVVKVKIFKQRKCNHS